MQLITYAVAWYCIGFVLMTAYELGFHNTPLKRYCHNFGSTLLWAFWGPILLPTFLVVNKLSKL